MNLLVAMDGSDESERALAFAIDISEAMNGSTTVVHAVDPAVYDEGGDEPVGGLSESVRRLVIENVEATEERGQRVIDDAVELATERGHEIHTELLYGDPVVEITDYAEDKGFDAIFVGHRGLSARSEWVLGSVAKAVVERASVPVTVVR